MHSNMPRIGSVRNEMIFMRCSALLLQNCQPDRATNPQSLIDETLLKTKKMYKGTATYRRIIEKTERIESESYTGFILKKKRVSKGLKQQDLADKLNVSRPTISNIEVGRHNVNLDLLKKICEFFNCKSSEFLNF